jgi:AcrR family transcriptional regulator
MSSTRVPLSRDRILATGLDLADEGGVEALTMRKLADRLGFEAMSLYRHVANKGDLLEGMLDLVVAEWELESAGDWREAVREIAVSVHSSLRRHPWAAPLLLTPAHGARPGRMEYMDALLARLREAGFDAETTYHAYHVLDGHIFGYSIWEISHMQGPADPGPLLERLKPLFERLPDLAAHVDAHFADGPHRQVSAFEFGLDLILDGLGDRE